MPRLSKEELMKRFEADKNTAAEAKTEAALNVSDEILETKTKEYVAAGETPSVASQKAYADAEQVENQLKQQLARVIFVFDKSGSMNDEYADGIMNTVAGKLAAVAWNFDDNGEAEVGIFSDYHKMLTQNMTPSNFYDYVDKFVKPNPAGTTRYAGIINEIVRQFGGRKGQALDVPVYVIFVTDGDNDGNDKSPARQAIIEAANYGIFWQFVGVDSRYQTGGPLPESEAKKNFPFLSELDDMDGRFVDNADFCALGGFETFDNDAIFSLLMNEFPGWVVQARSKGLIK